MALVQRIVKFCNKNAVFITGAGIIIGIHWMWDRLQHVTQLVPEKDRKELPIIKGVKYLKNKAVDQFFSIKNELLPSVPQENETKQE